MTDIAFKLRILRYLLRNAYEEWRTTIWERDLDSAYCCGGHECCCGGSSVREMWEWDLERPA